MKILRTTLLMMLLSLAAFGSLGAQCAAAHHTNPPILISEDTLMDFMPFVYCGHSPCSDHTVPHSEVVYFDIAATGNFRIVIQNHSPISSIGAVAMNDLCDSSFASVCIASNYTDTLFFTDSDGVFALMFTSVDPSSSITYRGNIGGPAVAMTPAPCFGATGTADPIKAILTYKSLDLLTGRQGDPQAAPPHGLSLRSDGVKVLSQGVPDGIVLIALAAFLIRLMFPTLKSIFVIRSPRE